MDDENYNTAYEALSLLRTSFDSFKKKCTCCAIDRMASEMFNVTLMPTTYRKCSQCKNKRDDFGCTPSMIRKNRYIQKHKLVLTNLLNYKLLPQQAKPETKSCETQTDVKSRPHLVEFYDKYRQECKKCAVQRTLNAIPGVLKVKAGQKHCTLCTRAYRNNDITKLLSGFLEKMISSSPDRFDLSFIDDTYNLNKSLCYLCVDEKTVDVLCEPQGDFKQCYCTRCKKSYRVDSNFTIKIDLIRAILKR